jgi:spermidine/putrescine transport system substrate-binding protein
MTQRNTMKRMGRTTRWSAGAAVVALVLTACGGGDGDADGDAAAAGECEVGATDGDLNLYNWADYMDPDLLAQFEEEFGVEVTEDVYPSNEELFARVESGGAQYDVIVPSDYMVDIMIQESLLMELDFDAIPNVDNIDEDFAAPPYDPDLAFSVPYQWGTTGLGVNLSVVGDVEPSWDLVFDPEVANELGGRISLLDDPRETMGAALYWLGYDPNTTDEDELQEAADVISASRDWVAAFESNQYSDLLLGGETVVAQGYSGNFLDNFGDDEDYAYLIPEEGATIWTDNMAILADAAAPCTAHTFLNFMLDAENGAQLTNWTFYASPNEAAEEFIVDDVLDNPAIYPEDEVLDNLFFLEDTGDSERLYTDFFTQAKS